MKTRLLTSMVAASIILLSTASYANISNNNNNNLNNNNSDPEKCPAVGALAAAGLNEAAVVSNNMWVVGQTSKYNTDKDWMFAVGFFAATDKEDALGKATTALSTLQFASGPYNLNDKTFCTYTIDLGENQKAHAVAVTPPLSNNVNLMLLRN